MSGTSTWSLTVLSGLPSIRASRLNSLARTISVRLSSPRSSRSRTSWAIGAVDLRFHVDQAGVAVLVRVPVQEGDVLGRDLNVARADLGQPPGQQTAQAEPAQVLLFVIAIACEGREGDHFARIHSARQVFGNVLPRLERKIESFGRGRAEQAVRVIQRAQERFLLIVAAQLRDRAARQELPVKAVPIFEARGAHPPGANRFGSLVRIGNIERAIFAAEETGGGECL